MLSQLDGTTLPCQFRIHPKRGMFSLSEVVQVDIEITPDSGIPHDSSQ
jgi:hypothetical protein